MRYSLAFAVAAVSFSACSDDDDDPKPDPTPDPEPTETYLVNLSLTDKGFTFDNSETFVPGYATGDKAGLFVVSQGQVIADNIQLTFDGTKWGTNQTISTLDNAALFFVYTPYQADASSKINAAATDAATFFASFSDYATPRADQSDFSASVRPYDVTIAAATVSNRAVSATTDLNLTASADHLLAVSSWELPGGTSYTTSSGFTYSAPGDKATATSIKDGSTEITPAQVNSKPSYFYLPAQNKKLTIAYTNGSESKTAEVALDAAAGQGTVTAIEGGSTSGGTRDLQIGDLYYTDGSVLPVEQLAELSEAPEGVAGVIFCVDPARFSDSEKELLGEVHALVVSAKMGQASQGGAYPNYITWNDAYDFSTQTGGDDGAGRYSDNIEDPNYPGLYLPLIEDRNSYMSSYEINNADIDGYKYTNIIKTRRANEISKGEYAVFTALEYLNSRVNVSSAKNTLWYLPSAGQVLDIMRNLGNANATSSTVEKYYYGEECDFNFTPESTSGLAMNLDSYIRKIATAEKDTWSASDKALWTSSYATAYSPHTDSYMSAARLIDFSEDILYCMSYDVIGRSNMRAVLAF